MSKYFNHTAVKALYIAHDEVNRADARSWAHAANMNCEARSHVRLVEVPLEVNTILWGADHVLFGEEKEIRASIDAILARGGQAVIHSCYPQQEALRELGSQPRVRIVKTLRAAFHFLQTGQEAVLQRRPMKLVRVQLSRKVA